MRRQNFGWRCLAWVLAAFVGGRGGLVLAGPPEVEQHLGGAQDGSSDRPAKPGGRGEEKKPDKGSDPSAEESDPAPLSAVLGVDAAPIDLDSALRLAGVSNPQILLARQRVVEALALRQYAAAQLLPNLNVGLSYDDHNGNLQQSSGNILKVDRNSLYVGAGAHAVAAGTVSIPGVYWNGNVSQTIYGLLIARQVVEVRKLATRAVENQMFLRVAVTYNELLRSEGLFAIARLTLENARDVEELTSAFGRAGVGRQSDTDRARTEREQRQAVVPVAEGETLIQSARLAELLNLPPCTRLIARDNKVVPCPVVPDAIPLAELLAIAILNRPELQEYQAIIRQALLAVDSAKLLPFSPNVIIGLSYGEEGGGSNLVHAREGTSNAAQGVNAAPGSAPFAAGEPRFGDFRDRLDFDVITFWALENLALGNKARIQLASAQLGTAQLQFLEQLNRVRAEVANAYARTHARFAQIGTAEQSIRDVMQTYDSDRLAVKGGEGKPIELLESLRLLARGRYAYLNAIADYNRAQLELYVALGNPPPNTLARPVPTNFSMPVPEAEQKKQK